MGSPGKKYPKKRLKELLEHHGTLDQLAEVVGMSRSNLGRINNGGTSHQPTHLKLDAELHKIRQKKSKKKSKYHQLTTRDVEIIQALNKKFGEKAYEKLGVSENGFGLLIKRDVGGKVMKKTADLIEKASKLVDTKPKGWLLKAIMDQQKADASPVDVSQDVTNALVRIEAKINTALENQEKILKFQEEFNTAWLT